jgi:sulfonate transport system permease protein
MHIHRRPFQAPSEKLHYDRSNLGTSLGHVCARIQRLRFGQPGGPYARSHFWNYPIIYRLLNPTIQAIRSVPSYAWVPLFILWFGIFETSTILLIGVGAFFPLYLATVTGIRNVDRKLVEVAWVNDFRGWSLASRVLLPASLPAIFVGLRQGLGLAWMFVVAAEFMGATHGLGFLLIDGQTTGRPSTLIASIILFAFCGKITDGCLAWISERALRWQDSYRP